MKLMPALTCSQKAYEHLRFRINLDVEEVWVIATNIQLSPVATEMIFRGTVEYSLYHPRDILRFICFHRASFFIIAHSHPSGDHSPSRKDLQVTRDLKKLSELVMIPMQDHLIISKNGYCSFADRGFFRKRGEPIGLRNRTAILKANSSAARSSSRS